MELSTTEATSRFPSASGRDRAAIGCAQSSRGAQTHLRVAHPNPGSPGQALGIVNQHVLVLQLDPAAIGEIDERIVDRFARRPYLLGDLLLDQVAGDPHVPVWPWAEGRFPIIFSTQ